MAAVDNKALNEAHVAQNTNLSIKRTKAFQCSQHSNTTIKKQRARLALSRLFEPYFSLFLCEQSLDIFIYENSEAIIMHRFVLVSHFILLRFIFVCQDIAHKLRFASDPTE